jgi:hypothetical protein
MMKKKKTRRDGKARHPMQIQDAKIVRKNQDKKKHCAHIKCFKCRDIGNFASGCPTKLEKKAQATHERVGNEKHNMSKEEKAQAKRMCYSCRKRDTWHIHIPKVRILSLVQLMILICLERMAMVPLWLQLQNIPLLILRLCLSMLLLT